MEFFTADLPVLTGTLRSKDESKSSLKVEAKLLSVGGIRVSPWSLTTFWYLESTTIDLNCLSENESFELDASKGTVGMPTHRAAALNQYWLTFWNRQLTDLWWKQDGYHC